jgi:large subunit ribosomal protein L2
MGIRKMNPVTAGTRHKVALDFSEITASKPEASLLRGRANKSGGRNGSGKMTMRYIGGGHKKLYRAVDTKRDKANIPGGGEDHRVRPEPQRTHRFGAIPGW